jgi:hypothetical protein
MLDVLTSQQTVPRLLLVHFHRMYTERPPLQRAENEGLHLPRKGLKKCALAGGTLPSFSHRISLVCSLFRMLVNIYP